MDLVIILVVVFLASSLLGLPIAFSLVFAAIVGMMWEDVPFAMAVQRMFVTADSFILLAIPFFILAGEIMTEGGLTKQIVDFSNALIGHFSAGLAQVNVLGSILFAGLSGSSAADTAAVGAVLIPAMEEQGYDKHFTIAVTCASGCIGPIIPPSIFMIIYAYVANMSVAALFMAGIIPGLVVGGMQMILCYYYGKIGKYAVGPGKRASLSTVVRTAVRAIPALVLPIIIIGGILFGIFTPTEAGAVACVYGLVLSFFYKKMRVRDLPRIFFVAAVRTIQVMLLSAAALIIAWLLAQKGFGPMLAQAVMKVSDNPTIILIIITALLAGLSCFLESLAATFILIPALHPVAVLAGIDPLHFAIVSLITIIVGGITPPVAPLLYIACSMAKGDVTQSILRTIPFLFITYGAVLICILFPWIVTVIPNTFLK
jgi:tripartite ATP-independent transporter DctM subunit